MSKSDKVIIGSAITIAASAVVMYRISKMCKDRAMNVMSHLMNVNHTAQLAREELEESNQKISDASRILRNLIKEDVKSEIKSRG